MEVDYDKYENVKVGINGRLDTIQAAILIEKNLKYSILNYSCVNKFLIIMILISQNFAKQYIPKNILHPELNILC